MQPSYVLTDAERDELYAVLETVDKNPYEDYPVFSQAVSDVVSRGDAPPFLSAVCERIRRDREEGIASAHVLRNCPLDAELPVFGHDNPHADKYAMKKTFIGEVLLELFAQLAGTPLLAYQTRFKGDFFTDVYAINRYTGKQTGFADGELVYHNDRTAHAVRADFITLLGMRCPPEELTYTGFVEGRSLLEALSTEEQQLLRQPHFITPFDTFSKDSNSALTVSERHPIFENQHSIRYLDTHTTVAPEAPQEAMHALISLRNALTRSEKKRHRILTGDLFTFANQDGLHNREKIEVNDPERSRSRWLLKTYAFRDDATADKFADRWIAGVRGRVGD